MLAPAPLRLGIVGGGAMGALALLTAQRIGALEVLVADINDQRLSSLRQLGASHTVNTGMLPHTEQQHLAASTA